MTEFHYEPTFTTVTTLPIEDKEEVKNIIKFSDAKSQKKEDEQLLKWLGPEIFAIAQKMKKEKEN